MLYDIPIRTGRKIASSTLLRLAHDVPNIVALKDAAGNPGATASVKAQAPVDFEIYSGDDSMTLPLMAIGAVGAIGVATHWCAPDHVAMFDAWERERHRRRPPDQHPSAGELRVRDQRRRTEPGTVEGHVENARS